jgi:hypothetical protein
VLPAAATVLGLIVLDRARFGGHRGVTAAPERQGD